MNVGSEQETALREAPMAAATPPSEPLVAGEPEGPAMTVATLPPGLDAALPAQGFLRLYVTYALACSDAPPIYHAAVAVTILAAAIADKVRCPFLSGRELTPHLYTVLTGPSGVRKTAAVDSGIDILRRACGTRLLPTPGSFEELIAQLRATPAGLLVYREFGHLLKTTSRGYGEPIRTLLMDLYDHPPDVPYTRNLRKGKTIIDPPICLSMLGAVADDLLFAYTDHEDWAGGFFGRMLLVHGAKEAYRMPLLWQQARDTLVQHLRAWMEASIPPCGGFSPAGFAALAASSQAHEVNAHRLPDRVQSFAYRAGTLVAKIALLVAVDSCEPSEPGWTISEDAVRRACAFVDTIYLPSVISLGSRLALGTWQRDRQRVLDVIDAFPTAVIHRDLLRRVRMSAEYLDSILETLRREGTIGQLVGAREPSFKRLLP